MSQASGFVPLGTGTPPARDFRPFELPGETPAPAGTPAEGALPATATEAPATEPGDEVRRAYRAGYEAARAEIGTQVESTVAESFAKAIEELAAFRTRLRDRYERELLEVALGVARKVVQRELAERPEIWLTMLRSAVHRTVERERIVVRVPAALATFLRERTPELRALLDNVKELDVVDDPGLPPTGCVVESRFGEVDIGVDTQLDAARAALLRADE